MDSIVTQLTNAATNTGNDLNTAFTCLSNGDTDGALAAINQGITDIAPILSQSVQLPTPGANKDGK